MSVQDRADETDDSVYGYGKQGDHMIERAYLVIQKMRYSGLSKESKELGVLRSRAINGRDGSVLGEMRKMINEYLEWQVDNQANQNKQNRRLE